MWMLVEVIKFKFVIKFDIFCEMWEYLREILALDCPEVAHDNLHMFL